MGAHSSSGYYLAAVAILVGILMAIAVVFWAIPWMKREKPHESGLQQERYGAPPGLLRAVHRDELGFRGWADMPGDYEGSSASAMAAFVERSA